MARRHEISIPELPDEFVELYRSRLNGGSIVVETHYCEDGYLASNLLLNAADAYLRAGKYN